MNELKVNVDTQTVSARELHEKLNIEKRFSAWFETNSAGFEEGIDFTSVLIGTEVPNNGGFQLRELMDFQLSIEMAKHICLMSRTEAGKQCRNYFIDLEKAWNTPEQIFARALKMADERIHSLQTDVTRMRPKEIFADAVSVSHTSILIGELAKILKQNGIEMGQNRLFNWLRNNSYLISRNGVDRNMPTQKSMELGLFEIKERTVNNPDGSVLITKTVLVNGKGQQYFINKFLS